ncbi:S66 family peptidase [Brevibacillus ginsengisoli]|uniref:S66 family peptidase n=1 Tax=Brevibacillus ginsengisoli TaxID=363854 RepID=UPI003CF68712
MIPAKLKKGDHIRIVSPARSMGLIHLDHRELARQQFARLGLTVSFSDFCEEMDEFYSSTIASRVSDLHDAFRDPQVNAILTTIGGFNSNQLLRYLDYELIQNHPKILCGYSDITAIATAIYAKTGLVTYSGPHFSTFGMEKGLEYTVGYFRKCLMQEEAFEVKASSYWSDDEWYLDQENREFIANEGPFVIQEGEATGTIIGGNLCTLNLLQGTEFMPDLTNAILFVEDDLESNALTFDRDLQSLLHLEATSRIRGLVIGRFQKASKVTRELLRKSITTKAELQGIPVVADLDFGHTTPCFPFPIGGEARLTVRGDQVKLVIEKH